MRKLIMTIATAGVLSTSWMSVAFAAPVAGFESQYADVLAVCQLPAPARPPQLTTTINAYSGALVAAAVPLATATASFQELRDEYEALCGDEASDALFEQLLPDTATIVTSPPAAGGTPAANPGSTGSETVPTPASPS